jgi:hypothetical protein
MKKSFAFRKARQLPTCDSKCVTQTEPDSNRRNSNKLNLTTCAAGAVGERGMFSSGLNLKYFIQAFKFRWLTQELLWPIGNLVWPFPGLYGQF